MSLVQLFNVFKHTLVELARADDEERVVHHVFDDIGINHQARRGRVEHYIIIALAQFDNQSIQPAVAQQLRGVGRYGAREYGINATAHEVMLYNLFYVVHLAHQVIGEARMVARIEQARQRATPQVEVQHHRALAGEAKAGGEVRRDERLAHAGHE